MFLGMLKCACILGVHAKSCWYFWGLKSGVRPSPCSRQKSEYPPPPRRYVHVFLIPEEITPLSQIRGKVNCVSSISFVDILYLRHLHNFTYAQFVISARPRSAEYTIGIRFETGKKTKAFECFLTGFHHSI